jgi:chaperonin GroES
LCRDVQPQRLADAPVTSFPGWRLRGRRSFALSNTTHAKKDEMKLRPLYDRLLVTRTEEQHKTTGGLFIPDTAKEKPMEARVVAVGNGKLLEDGSLRKLEVKAGDKVLFAKYSGNEIKIDGTDHLILREDDVLAVID